MIGWLRLAIKPVLLAAGLVGAGLLLRQFGLHEAIRRAGDHGPASFVLLGGLVCAIGIPRQVVAYAGGLAFGFWAGAALALAAEAIGCAANFWWVRLVGRRWVMGWLARGGRLAKLDGFLTANAFQSTLIIRLLPFGSNMALNLLAGVSGVAAAPFLAASMLGYMPQTAVFALLGSGTRVSAGLQIGLAAVLFAFSFALGLLLWRRRPIPA